MKTIFKILVLSFIFIGCKESNKKEVAVNKKVAKISYDSIDYKIKNNEKLFANFWIDMTVQEYKYVSKKLDAADEFYIDENGQFMFFGMSSVFYVEPSFKNDNLYAIELKIKHNYPKNIDLESIRRRYNIHGDKIDVPENSLSTDGSSIVKTFVKKYGKPQSFIVNGSSKNELNRWKLKNRIIEIETTDVYLSYAEMPKDDGNTIKMHTLKESVTVDILIRYTDIKRYNGNNIEKEYQNQQINKHKKFHDPVKDYI